MSGRDDRPPAWVDGHVAVPPRVASVLMRAKDLTSLRITARAEDRETYDVIRAIHWAGLRYDERLSPERNDAPDRAKQGSESSEVAGASTCWVDTAEVVKELGVGSRRVQQLVKTKQLKGEMRSRRWWIDLASVQEYRRRRAA